MLQVLSVVMGATDVRRAARFWQEALGLVPSRDYGPDDDFIRLIPPDGQGTAIALDTSESPVQRHPRVHLDLFVDSAAEQAVEVERLISLGGTRVDWDLYPDSPDFVVMADTEGNIFCVVDMSRG